MTRATLLAEHPTLESHLLPPKFDDALLGVATRGYTGTVPTYGYSKLLQLIEGFEGWRRFVLLQDLFRRSPDTAPLCLSTMPPAVFWKLAKAGKMIAWERLHPAILGVGLEMCISGTQATVYDTEHALRILIEETHMIGEDPSELVAEALSRLRINAIEQNRGPQTPWFLNPVTL